MRFIYTKDFLLLLSIMIAMAALAFPLDFDKSAKRIRQLLFLSAMFIWLASVLIRG